MTIVSGRGRAGERAIPTLVRASDVQCEDVEFLWPERIPLGMITLLVGNGGVGKSLVVTGIAAGVSRGAPFPDAPRDSQPAGDVVLLNHEDSLSKTIVPRLAAAGADLDRVHILQSLYDLNKDLNHLSESIDALENCRLVILDPISDYLGKTNSYDNCEVRAALTPLVALAAEKSVAVLLVSHLKKGDGEAVHRAIGSVAFVAVARAVWGVVKDRTEPRRRLMLPIKNNLATDTATGMAFTVEGPRGRPYVCWSSELVTVTADEAMEQKPKRRGPAADQREEAAGWLRSILTNGPRAAREVINEARPAGINERTLQRAFREIKGVRTKDGFAGGWLWSLPEDDTKATDGACPQQPVALGETCRLGVNPEENGTYHDCEDDRFIEGDKFNNWGGNVTSSVDGHECHDLVEVDDRPF